MSGFRETNNDGSHHERAAAGASKVKWVTVRNVSQQTGPRAGKTWEGTRLVSTRGGSGNSHGVHRVLQGVLMWWAETAVPEAGAEIRLSTAVVLEGRCGDCRKTTQRQKREEESSGDVNGV